MSVTLILHWSGILLGILFIAAALSACGGSSAPATQVSGSSTPDEGTTTSVRAALSAKNCRGSPSRTTDAALPMHPWWGLLDDLAGPD